MVNSLSAKMEQTVILVDKKDKFLGYASREKCHTGKGLRHRAFVTLLFNHKGQVLLQKRKHMLFDGLWDFTAISHPLHLEKGDESYQEASDRALKKEVGIAHVEVKKVGGFNYYEKENGNCENEYCAVLAGEWNGKVKPNFKEVYEVKWVDYKKFLIDISKNKQKYAIWAQKGAEVLESRVKSQESRVESRESGEFKKDLDNFVREFEQYRQKYFQEMEKAAKRYPPLVLDFYKTLENFSKGGKATRPYLLWLGYRISQSGKPRQKDGQAKSKGKLQNILPICLAFELIHSFFLIHDDIIDKSDTRRGKPTVHKVYEKRHGGHYGISQALILGDLAAFEAFDLVNKSGFDPKVKSLVLGKLVEVLKETGYGEALDVLYSAQRANEDEVWQMVDLKTARYSFAGPLVMGAILGQKGRRGPTLNLEKYGLAVGKAFQLRDDFLGVFGDEKKMGKSVLGDLHEGKNNLLYHRALKLAKGKEKEILLKIWGNEKAKIGDLNKVRYLMEGLGIDKWANEQMGKLVLIGKGEIAKIEAGEQLKRLLSGIADFAIEREN